MDLASSVSYRSFSMSHTTSKDRRRARRVAAMAASGGKSAATPSFCGNWVVALLDIMGYRAALMKMNVFPLPEDEQGQADLNAKVARTYGMRRMFIDSMKN